MYEKEGQDEGIEWLSYEVLAPRPVAMSLSRRHVRTADDLSHHTILHCSIDIHQEYQRIQVANIANSQLGRI